MTIDHYIHYLRFPLLCHCLLPPPVGDQVKTQGNYKSIRIIKLIKPSGFVHAIVLYQTVRQNCPICGNENRSARTYSLYQEFKT